MIPDLIILEGPDCAGKTVLAKFLAAQLRGQYCRAHYTEKLGHAMRDYQFAILDNARENIRMGHKIILDRHWPSEYAYSLVHRPNMFNPATHEEMRSLIQEMGGIYVYCMDAEVVGRHVASQKTHDHDHDIEKFVKVCDVYQTLFETGIHEDQWVRYDMLVHGPSLHEVIKMLDV